MGRDDVTDKLSNMPDVDDLRAIARAGYEMLRGERKETPNGAYADLAFAKRELVALGHGPVFTAEWRRHELLTRGFTPPDDLAA
jgi:hypothetical protein